jgi:hypothetical protein
VTKTAIRAIPRQLPHASIYLDDLFEIEDLFLAQAAARPTPISIAFEYVLDGSIKITTREELIEHGGSCSEFSLRLRSEETYVNTSVINIIGMAHIQFEIPYFLSDQAWEIFGKVEQIFKTRRDRMKAFADALPNKAALLPLAWVLVLVVVSLLLHRSLPPSLYWGGALLLFSPFLFDAIGIWKKNLIYLRFIRMDQKARSAAWKDRAEKLVWLLIGLAVGLLFDRFKR